MLQEAFNYNTMHLENWSLLIDKIASALQEDLISYSYHCQKLFWSSDTSRSAVDKTAGVQGAGPRFLVTNVAIKVAVALKTMYGLIL